MEVFSTVTLTAELVDMEAAKRPLILKAGPHGVTAAEEAAMTAAEEAMTAAEEVMTAAEEAMTAAEEAMEADMEVVVVVGTVVVAAAVDTGTVVGKWMIDLAAAEADVALRVAMSAFTAGVLP